MMTLIRTLTVAGTICAAAAQSIPKLKTISQEYVQRGSTIEVTITGENLSDAKFLITGEPGVQFKLPPSAGAAINIESSAGGITAITKSDPNKLVAMLDVNGMAALGSREIRVASAAGVSNPLTLTVTHLPEFAGSLSATSIEKAQELSLPFAVTAKINGASERDFYRFKASKGQHVVLEVVAQRLGSQLDSSLAVLDKEGRELARNEDGVGNDSVLDFVAPADGEYVAQVGDYRLQGGDNFSYRLLAGSLPYVRAAFPFAGRRGETTEVTLRGYNLQGAEKMILQLDSKARLGQQELRTTAANGLSNPFAFIVSDLPEVMESEPNTSLTHANAVSLPTGINGRIQNAKDYDAFRFHVEKDQRWIFEVAAQRFGSPLDALLTLTDERGNVLQKNDDANSPDARIDQTFAAAGDYILVIEDLLEHGGPEFTYRITATQPKADFEVKLVNDTPRVNRGGRVPVRCELTRNNVNEPVRITAVGLATGLHAEPLILTQNDPGAGLLFVSAAADAPLGSTPLELRATAVINGQSVTHRVAVFSGDRAVKAAYVTVLEQAPFLIHNGNLLATVEQDQSVNIDALIERREGFNGEIKVSLEGFSAGREPATKSFDYQPITIKGSESRGTVSAKAKTDSEVGARMMVLRGDAMVNGQTMTQYSPPFPVATSEIPFMLTTTMKRVVVTAVPPGSQSSANEAVFQVKANRRAGFNGDIELKLEGVPEGITATVDKIPGSSGEATVKLLASDKVTPTTKEISLNLTGVGSFRDKTYRFKPQPIALQVNAPEPTDVKTAEVKPVTEPAANVAK